MALKGKAVYGVPTQHYLLDTGGWREVEMACEGKTECADAILYVTQIGE